MEGRAGGMAIIKLCVQGNVRILTRSVCLGYSMRLVGEALSVINCQRAVASIACTWVV